MVAPSGQQADEDSERLDSMTLIEVRIAPTPAQISAVRVVAADLAARQDYDLDAVSDLRMAVDEACATLVPLAVPGTMLSCRFLVAPATIEVLATVEAGHHVTVPQNTFGWRVLTTLIDEVQAVSSDGAGGGRPMAGIRLCLRRERAGG